MLEQITGIPVSQVIEKRHPRVGIPAPTRPRRGNLIFEFRRQIPERQATRWGENGIAAGGCHRAGDPRLGENVGFWESSGKNGLARCSQNSLGIPPAGTIHFAKSGDGQAEFQQVGRINIHRLLRAPLRGSQQDPTGDVDEFEGSTSSQNSVLRRSHVNHKTHSPDILEGLLVRVQKGLTEWLGGRRHGSTLSRFLSSKGMAL